MPEPADICMILEGTYPYTEGGVSSWTHELLQMQNHLSFALVSLVSRDASTELLYELPKNVTSLTTLRLQSLPEGCAKLSKDEETELFTTLEKALLLLQMKADLSDLGIIIDALTPYKNKIGKKLLLDSQGAWEMLLRMYNKTMPKKSFLDYFWSWRGLFGGLYSVLLAEIPSARAYHALCTGYAGLMLARTHLETGKPCMVTEHGIYTNERRIEIASADWLDDPSIFNLSVDTHIKNMEIKDFWTNTFNNYSRFCYEAASHIITLYEGNQEFQLADGATPDKLRIIPNGIDTTRYSKLEKRPHPPTIALIGRIVPIKDIKTYIKAVAMLAKSLPGMKAFMLGPADEDPEYAKECFTLHEYLGLEDILVFTGKVNISEYLSRIDVIVLTSISEAQPLVILEAGAAGIPTVATNVGSCHELIMGDSHEEPPLGAGGMVVPIASPKSVADALYKLLTDKNYYHSCSNAISARVERYYSKHDQYMAYSGLYGEILAKEKVA